MVHLEDLVDIAGSLDVEPIDMAPLCPVANGSQPNPELVIAKHAWWVKFASFDLVRP